jgi:hypothetical protein
MSLKKRGRVPRFGLVKSVGVTTTLLVFSLKGDSKRCRLPWLTNSALVYELKCGERGWSCGVSANEYSCAQEAQINFGDLTLHLTYDFWGRFDPRDCLVANVRQVLGHGEWEVAIQDALGWMLKGWNC